MKSRTKALAICLLASGLVLSSCSGTTATTGSEESSVTESTASDDVSSGESSSDESPDDSSSDEVPGETSSSDDPETSFSEEDAIAALKGLGSVALSGIAMINFPELGALDYYGMTGIYTDEYFYHGVSEGSDGTAVGTIAPLAVYENNGGYLATRSLGRDNTVTYVNETDENGDPIAYSDVYYQPFANIDESSVIWDAETLTLSLFASDVSDGLSVLFALTEPSEDYYVTYESYDVVFDENLSPVSLFSVGWAEMMGYTYILSIDLDFVEPSSLEEGLDWGVEPYPDEEGQDGVGEILETLQNATSYTAYLGYSSYSSYEGMWEIKVVDGVGVYAKNTYTSSPTHRGTLQVGDSYVTFDGLSSTGNAFYQTSEPIEGNAVDAYFASVGEGVTPDYDVAQQFFDVNGSSYELKEEFGTEYFKYLLPIYGLLEDVYPDGFFDISYDWGGGDVDAYPLTISGTTANPKISFLYNIGDWPYNYNVTFKDINSTTIDITDYGYEDDLEAGLSWADILDEDTLETWSGHLNGALAEDDQVAFEDVVPFYNPSGYTWTLYSSLSSESSICYYVMPGNATATSFAAEYAETILESGFVENGTSASDAYRNFLSTDGKYGMRLEVSGMYLRVYFYVIDGSWGTLLSDFDTSSYDGIVSTQELDTYIPYFNTAYGWKVSSSTVLSAEGYYEYALQYDSGMYVSSSLGTDLVKTAASAVLTEADGWSETDDGWEKSVDGKTYTVRVYASTGMFSYFYVCFGAYTA